MRSIDTASVSFPAGKGFASARSYTEPEAFVSARFPVCDGESESAARATSGETESERRFSESEGRAAEIRKIPFPAMVFPAGMTKTSVPPEAAFSIRNHERSISSGQRLRSSTYWVLEDPLEDHITSLMTTEADTFAKRSETWALPRASSTADAARDISVVP